MANEIAAAFNDAWQDGPASLPLQPQKDLIRNAGAVIQGEVTRIDGRIDGVVSSQALGIRYLTQIVRGRATANVNLTSGLVNGATFNGMTLVTGDVIFLGSQSTGATITFADGHTDSPQNGLYTVVASGAASRSIFADSAAELSFIGFVLQTGTVGTGERWTLSLASASITVNTTPLPFSLSGTEPGYAPEVSSARQGEANLSNNLTAMKAATADIVANIFVPRATPDDIGVQGYTSSRTAKVISKTDWKGRPYLGVVRSGPLVTNDSSALFVIRPGKYTSTQNTGTIDLRGLGSARIKIKVGRQGVTFDGTNNIIFSLEKSADGITWSNSVLGDFAGQDAPVSVSSGVFLRFDTAHMVATDHYLTYVGGANFIRVKAIFSGTHGTGTNVGVFVTRGVVGGGIVSTTQVSPAINLRGATVSSIAFFLGRQGIPFTAGNKIGFRLESSSDGAAWADVAAGDLSGTDAPSTMTGGIVKEWVSDHYFGQPYAVYYHGGKNYLRMSWVFTGTHATGTFCDATIVAEKVLPLRNSKNAVIFDPLKRDPLRDPQIPRVLLVSREKTDAAEFSRCIIDRADYDVMGTFSVSEDGLVSPDRHNRIYPDYGQSNTVGSGELNPILTRAYHPDHIRMASSLSGINNYSCGTNRVGIPLPSNIGPGDIQRFIPGIDRESGPGGQLSNLHGQKLISGLVTAITELEKTAFGAPRTVKFLGNFGVGAATVAALVPSAAETFKPYFDLTAFVQAVVTIEGASGEKSVVELIPFKQGEGDGNTVVATYITRAIEIFRSLTIDTMAITGQVHEPPILMSQHTYYSPATAGNANEAMRQLAHAGEVILGGPDYPLQYEHSENLYADIAHFKCKGTLKHTGSWMLRAAQFARFGDRRPRWMEPVKATVSGTTITVTFSLAEKGFGGTINTGVTDQPGTLNGVTVTQTGGTARTVSSMTWGGTADQIAAGVDVLTVQISGTLDGTSPLLNFGVTPFQAVYAEADRPRTRLNDTQVFSNPLDALLGYGVRTYKNHCIPVSLPVT